MITFLLAWLVVALVMLPIDYVWLRSMHWFYEQNMGDLLLAKPRMWIAAVFYVVLAAAIAFFAVLPNLGQGAGMASGTWVSAAAYGAFLGFAAYGTYDATNHATLKDFPISVMAVDWIWGTTLCGTVAALVWWIMTSFFKA